MFGLIWIALGFSALWLVLGMALRLFRYLRALDITIKNQRRARRESRIGDASQLTGFNGGEIEPLSHELQEMGFVHLGDLIFKIDTTPVAPVSAPLAPIADPHASKTGIQTTSDAVGRIFAHPNHGCYASLISAVSVSRFPPEMMREDMVEVAPFRTVIVSLSGNSEDAWSFATHNREVQTLSLLYRHPRGLSHRMVGAGAAQLLESHLAERDAIASRGGFGWDKAPTLEKYQEFEARALRHISEVHERATALGWAWKLFLFRFGKHERWMGELASR